MTKLYSTSRSALGLAAAAFLALSACHKHEEAAGPTPTAEAGPTVTGGKLVLPAVAGHPAAAYFTLTNGGAATTITAIAVEGANRAEMHETTGAHMQTLSSVALAAGEKLVFAPGGKHVMVFSLKPSLAVGGTTKITFTFSGGGTLSAPLRIEAVGGENSMGGMKM